MLKINDKEIKNVDDLKEIVEKDVSILKEFEATKTDIRTYNIYMYVCMYGTPEMLKYLETYLSDIKEFKDEKNNDSYLIASKGGNLEVMKYLEKEHNWSTHVKNIYGCLEIMKYLEKEHNWPLNVKDIYRDDAYLLASFNGRLKIMEYLEKEHNWDIHVKNNYGGDAYLLASYKEHLEIMEYLEKEHNWLFKYSK